MWKYVHQCETRESHRSLRRCRSMCFVFFKCNPQRTWTITRVGWNWGGGHLLLWNTAHLRRVSAVRGGGAPESIERGYPGICACIHRVGGSDRQLLHASRC